MAQALRRMTGCVTVAVLIAGLCGARADDICIPFPPALPAGATESELRENALKTARAALCQVEQARDRKDVLRARHDKEYWKARTGIWRDYIALIKSRTRFPTASSRQAERRRQRLREIATQFSTYDNLAAELWMMQHYPPADGPGPGTVSRRLIDNGLDPKAEFERIAREVRQPSIPPWFVIGKVELIDRGVNKERIRAEEAYVAAEREAESIAQIVAEEKARFARAEAADLRKRRELAEKAEKERQTAVRTITVGRRLTSQLEVIAADLARRNAAYDDALWRDYRTLKRYLDQAAETERKVATTAAELARIKRLQRIRLDGLKSERFLGRWKHPKDLAGFQSGLDKVNASLDAARAAALSARQSWEEATESWRKALAEVEAASGELSPYLQAFAQIAPEFVDQAWSIVSTRGGGPASILLGTVYQGWMNFIDPPTIHSADDLLELTDRDRADAEYRKSIAKTGFDTNAAQLRRRLADGHLQKQIASGRLDAEQLREAARQLAAERKAFNDFARQNGFKTFAKNYAKELKKGLLKGAAIDLLKRKIALWIDGVPAEALFAASTEASIADHQRRVAAELLDAAEKKYVEEAARRRDMLIGESDAFSTIFQVVKNEAFFAEEGYSFTLTADRATSEALRQSATAFTATLGGAPLHRSRTGEGAAEGEWLVSFVITPEAEASIARLRDLEQLSLKIFLTAR